ncbi:MAG TPA: hypothetical protein VGJ92_01710 [Methanocella sp.]|jgi:hypothetical protein
MKWNSILIAVLGLIVVAAAALAFIQMSSQDQAGTGDSGAVRASATPVPPPTRSDVLDRFSVLREKINASGQSYGGAAIQLIDSEDVAMVYIYKPVGLSDIAGLLVSGFDALYTTFDTRDPLLVGVVDTTQKISAQQFKVDIYALERSVVAGYKGGNMTAQELMKKALYVTPETTSLHPGNNTTVKKSVSLNYNRPGNYTPPSNRTMIFNDYLQQGGYANPAGFQAGAMSDGTQAVSVTMPLKTGATTVERYAEIETVLKACAAGYGDYDRYLISLIPTQEGIYDYYSVDASAAPAIAFANGDISQYQLYKAINMTYYTK